MKNKILNLIAAGILAAGCGGMDEDYLKTNTHQNLAEAKMHEIFEASPKHFWPVKGDCQNKEDGESCSDGTWCNGLETCFNNICWAGTAPCNSPCDENNKICATECVYDSDCDDSVNCNGTEWCCTGNNTDLGCEKYSCYRDVPGPCGDRFWAPLAICDTTLDQCRGCYTDNECDDGLYCTGIEVCLPGYPYQGTCSHVYETIPCLGENLFCDEENDRCYNIPPECEYDYQCDFEQYCDESGKCQDL